MITGLVIALLILFVEVDKIVKIASSFMLLTYIMENITVIVLRENFVQWYQPPYKASLSMATDIWYFCLLWDLLFMGKIVAISIRAFSIGSTVYLFYGKQKTNRKGVVRIRGRRLDLIDDKPIIKSASQELFF